MATTAELIQQMKDRVASELLPGGDLTEANVAAATLGLLVDTQIREISSVSNEG